MHAYMSRHDDAICVLHRQRQVADLSWKPACALNRSRFLHNATSACKENMGDREEEDMPAAGIGTSGPGTGSSNIGDAGKAHDFHKSCK